MKNFLFWFTAFIITISAAIYQRTTGPTDPARMRIMLNGEEYRFKLVRSHTITEDFFVTLENADEKLKGYVVFRRYPTYDNWQDVPLFREGQDLKAQLPLQPPAGKIEYYLILNYGNEVIRVAEDRRIIIRFKDHVPDIFLIPHILFMFLAMLFSSYTGILAAFKDIRFKSYAKWTLAFLVVGGLIFGPIIQNYAFGDWWTGWPLGKDLTDNKTLIVVIVWGAAVLFNCKKERNWLAILAAIMLIAAYSIPHSTMGSEFDYETGRVVTGSIHFLN